MRAELSGTWKPVIFAVVLPRLERLSDALEERRHQFLTRLRSLNPEQLQFRPRPGAWSLLQVARHLAIAEEAGAAYRPREAAAGGPLRRNWRHRFGYAAVWFVVTTGVRVRVPAEGLSPESDAPLDETEERWERAGAALRDRLAPLDEEGARGEFLRHPIGGPMDAEQSLRFYIRHFDHHMRQVRRIMAAPGYPASPAA